MRALRLLLPTIAGIAFVHSANAEVLYVSNHDSGFVSLYDAATGTVLDAQFISTPGQPHGVIRVGDEVLVASWSGTSRIARHDAATGAFLGIFADASSQLSQPADLRIGPDGFLWVASQGNARINRYDLTTGLAQPAFLAEEPHLAAPSGMAFSPDATRFFVTDRFDGEVLEYDVATGAYVRTISDFAGSAFGIQWAPDGQLYVGNGGLRRLSPDAPFTSALVAPGTLAIGVEMRSDGELFYADYSEDEVRQYDLSTGVSDFIAAPGLNGPNFFHFAVPEPSAAWLLLSGVPLLGRRRREA